MKCEVPTLTEFTSIFQGLLPSWVEALLGNGLHICLEASGNKQECFCSVLLLSSELCWQAVSGVLWREPAGHAGLEGGSRPSPEPPLHTSPRSGSQMSRHLQAGPLTVIVYLGT